MTWICKKCETENPDELDECEVCGSSLQVCELEDKLEAIEKEHAKLKNANEEQKHEIQELIGSKYVLEKENAKLNDTNVKLQKQILILKNEKNQLEQEINKNAREHRDRVISLNNTISSLQKENTTNKSRITKLKNEANQSETTIKNLKSTISQKDESLATIKLYRNILFLLLLVSLVPLYLYFFPNEVAHKDMGGYVYYGPLKNNKPHGMGVAVYPLNDKDGRRYYIGNFVNGERQDSTAILLYSEGSFYYGSMYGDEWDTGMFYDKSKKSHFEGYFRENNPYNGTWYVSNKKQTIFNGN